MKRTWLLILGLVIAALLVSGVSFYVGTRSNKGQIGTSSNVKTFKSTRGGYEFTYPYDWVISEERTGVSGQNPYSISKVTIATLKSNDQITIEATGMDVSGEDYIRAVLVDGYGRLDPSVAIRRATLSGLTIFQAEKPPHYMTVMEKGSLPRLTAYIISFIPGNDESTDHSVYDQVIDSFKVQ